VPIVKMELRTRVAFSKKGIEMQNFICEFVNTFLFLSFRTHQFVRVSPS
jgi:hypothetical protein